MTARRQAENQIDASPGFLPEFNQHPLPLGYSIQNFELKDTEVIDSIYFKSWAVLKKNNFERKDCYWKKPKLGGKFSKPD